MLNSGFCVSDSSENPFSIAMGLNPLQLKKIETDSTT